MAIDLTTETPVSITDAPQLIPGRPSLATVWRWALRGVRGNRLESYLVGARRFTTHEAIERFIDRSNPGGCPAGQVPEPTPPALTAARRKQIAAAERACAEAGI